MYYYEVMKSEDTKLTHGYFIDIGEKIFEKQSKYQHIEVYEGPMGKVLLLDGVIQQAGIDERFYHESLVHYPIACHPEPKNVLVLGGGDGCAVREILKHKSVERIVLVDIDEVMVEEVGKGVLKDMNEGALENERVEILVQDAKKFVRETGERFDVVFMDLVDPYDDPKFQLYAQEQIKMCKRVLAEEGILCSHLEYLNPANIACKLFAVIKPLFAYSHLYFHHVPSFNEPWAFGVFSDSIDFKNEEVKEKAKARFAQLELEELSPEFVEAISYLPARYKKAIEHYVKEGVDGIKVKHIPGTASKIQLGEKSM